MSEPPLFSSASGGSNTAANENHPNEAIDDQRREITPHTFDCTHGLVRDIRTIMEHNFTHPWHQFHLVPQTQRDLWFNLFHTYYNWNPNHDNLIRKLWDEKAGELFKSMMKAARKKRELAAYMSDEIYAALNETWKSPKFIESANTNRENAKKNEERLKIHYRGGAYSVGTIRKKMEEGIGHEPSEDRVYKRCWGMPDGTMPTQGCSETNVRLRTYHEDVVLTADPEQTLPPPQENQALIQAYGGINRKDRIPGMGSVSRAAKLILRGSSSRSTCASSSYGYVRSEDYQAEIRRRNLEQEQLEREHQEIQHQLEREREQAQQERADMLGRLREQDSQIAMMK